MDNTILIIIFGFLNLILLSIITYFIFKAYTLINTNQNEIKTIKANLEVLLDGNFNLNQKAKDLSYNYAVIIQSLSKSQFNTISNQKDQKIYKQAKQLNQMGANSEEIKSSYNLSQMEMELIEALGKQDEPLK